MQVKISGSANLSQAKAEFAALEAQIAGLHALMAKSAGMPVGPIGGYQKLSGAVNAGSDAFRNSLASTGAFRVEQMRLNSATSHYTDLLQKQKLSFKDIRKNQQVMKSAYREQIAMQRMTTDNVRSASNNSMGGRGLYDVATPRAYSNEIGTLNQRLGWHGQLLKSAGTQMVNFGKNTQWAGRQLTVGLTMPVVAFGAAAGVMAYQIDKEMTRIKKVYDTTADQSSSRVEDMAAVTKEFADLEKASWNTAGLAAKEYGSSIKDTLAVQAELAATGQTGAKLQGATTEVMKSAMLGEIDYNTATTATIALQQQLHLSTKDLTDSWAYMNSVENSTSLQMKDFASAIPVALGPMKQMGGSLQDLGTLMTAMISRGVQAGKAANAIKALPQRLLRPGAQVQEEWKQLTGTDIMEIAEKNGGNVMKMLNDISKATEGLSQYKEGKAFAGLFGSYQLTTMSNMIAGIRDLENGVGQTTKAFEIGQQSTKEWAQVSKQEIKAYQESASGQFKRMLEDLKIQLGALGEPFLEVASKVGKGIAKGLEMFNDLPSIAKKAVALPILFAALAGPVLMLTGLFYNLAGQAVRGTGTLLAMGKGMKILTAEENAMSLVHQKEQAAMANSVARGEARVFQLGLLSQATDLATKTQIAFALSEKGVDPSRITAALAGQTAETTALGAATEKTTVLLWREAQALKAQAAAAAALYNKRAVSGSMGYVVGGQGAEEKRLLAQRDAVLAQRREVMRTEREAAKSSTLIATNANNTDKGMRGAAVGSAAMAASMVLMMGPGNETSKNIGTWLMIAAIAVPAAKGLAVAMSGVAATTAAAATQAYKNTIALNSSFVAAVRLNGVMGATLVRARAMGAAFSTMMGPIGWIAAALASLGFVAYKIYKSEKKRTEELVNQSKALGDQKNLMIDMLDIRPKTKNATVNVGGNVAGADSAIEIAKAIKKTESGKNLIAQYNSDGINKQTIATAKYIQVLQSVGGNAEKAERYLTAMFIAAGSSAVDAADKAAEYRNELGGTIERTERLVSLTNQMSMAAQPPEQSGWDNFWDAVTSGGSADNEFKQIVAASRKIGHELSVAMANGGKEAEAAMQLTQQALTSQWTGILDDVEGNTLKQIQKFGLNTGEELRRAMLLTKQSDLSPEQQKEGLVKMFNLDNMEEADALFWALRQTQKDTGDSVANVLLTENEITKALGSHLNYSEKILNLDEARTSWEFKLLTANKDNAAALIQQNIERMKAKNNGKSLTAEQRLHAAQTVLTAAKLGQANSYSEALALASGKSKKEILGAAAGADTLKNKLKGIDRLVAISVQFNRQDVMSVRKAGMTGAMSDMADAATTAFDNRMNSSLDASQRGWDNRIAANDEAAERSGNRLESKWERINNASDRKWERRKSGMEKFYDRRIDATEKAIKAEQKAEETRQKIFEAEKTRIERLNDMANRSIDFNVAINEGNLDEAAKIRNDVAAQQADWALSDAGDAGKSASEKRVSRMENNKSRLEDKKDAALKQLEKNEKAAKNSLARREKSEKKHMERMQKARANDLKRQADADMANQKRRWDYEKKSLDDKISLFRSFIPKDKKQMERWMKQVGLSYDDFGTVLGRKGEKWSTWFQNSMVKHTRMAANEIRTDKMWAEMGKDTLKAMLNGMGFKGMNEFKTFIKSGSLPANFGTRNLGGESKKKGPNKRPPITLTNAVRPESRHTGGEIGSGPGSRKGVARTLKGRHPSERMVNAQVGEYMVNRRDAAKNRPLLDAINSGKMNSVRNVGDGVGGGVQGNSAASSIAAVAMAGVSKMVASGLGQMMQTAFKNKQSIMAAAAASGGFSAGKGGLYGDRGFNGQQLKNAATIANVGSSMGMSKRDIQIGIMTAIAESGLINVRYGDRDSLGLFQQRPSQGWGTPEQVTDPQYASRKFFSSLKGVGSRAKMSPWMAAQTVQRSAFSDGSNYQQYWDEAMAIYTRGLSRNKNGGFKVGSGGKAKASIPGKGWSNSHDYRNGIGSPLFAVDDGRIIQSRAITSGGSPGNGLYGGKYRSYGETILLRTKGGDLVRYAHLNPNSRMGVGPVSGGTLIGRSGVTGNASGPHTHFDINGSYDARGWFQRNGIGLSSGGYTTSDGMANLHKDEVVISPRRTDDLYRGLDKFSSVMDSVRNIGYGTGGEPMGKMSPTQGLGRLFSVGAFSDLKTPGGGWNDVIGSTSGSAGSSSGGGYNGGGADTGRGTTVKTGTYNVLRTTSNAATQKDVARLMSRGVNVLSLTEWEGHKKAMGDWFRSKGWGVHNAVGRAADTGIAWNNSVYSMLGGGTAALNDRVHGKRGQRARYAAYAELKDRQSGREFWQVSVHTTNKARKNAANRAVQAEQWRNLAALYERLKGTGQPVFMAGDFNAGIGRSNEIHKNLKSNFSKGGATGGTFGRGRGKIDHIMTDSSVKQLSTAIMSGSSDHNALYGTYRLPQLRTGGYTMSEGLANLHGKELVVDAARTKILHEGIENLASGGGNVYNLGMTFHGDVNNKEEIANFVMKAIEKKESRKPQSRRRP